MLRLEGYVEHITVQIGVIIPRLTALSLVQDLPLARYIHVGLIVTDLQ